MEDKYPEMNHNIPPLVLSTLQAYRDTGRPTGSFTRAAIANNLLNAVRHADEQSLAAIRSIAYWIYWNLPTGATGSDDKYKAWVKRGGLEGVNPMGVDNMNEQKKEGE